MQNYRVGEFVDDLWEIDRPDVITVIENYFDQMLGQLVRHLPLNIISALSVKLSSNLKRMKWKDIAKKHGLKDEEISYIKTGYPGRYSYFRMLLGYPKMQPYTVGELIDDLKVMNRQDVIDMLISSMTTFQQRKNGRSHDHDMNQPSIQTVEISHHPVYKRHQPKHKKNRKTKHLRTVTVPRNKNNTGSCKVYRKYQPNHKINRGCKVKGLKILLKKILHQHQERKKNFHGSFYDHETNHRSDDRHQPKHMENHKTNHKTNLGTITVPRNNKNNTGSCQPLDHTNNQHTEYGPPSIQDGQPQEQFKTETMEDAIRVIDLPTLTKDKLSVLLDPDRPMLPNWEHVAERRGLNFDDRTHIKTGYPGTYSYFKRLLDHPKVQGYTVEELEADLQAINRQDALDALYSNPGGLQ